ncbi:hypothetical protein MSG28_013678 [Choristoneura fumiferana]|uniref:Uncharacterized protein n=1 Tax=Choristoneura fumiferana TaxID=7141 RepID=A0ACC0K8X4_CHOFU|nr:hypothetical protein MSG28_013678 [Choristoneura fumiferana]
MVTSQSDINIDIAHTPSLLQSDLTAAGSSQSGALRVLTFFYRRDRERAVFTDDESYKNRRKKIESLFVEGSAKAILLKMNFLATCCTYKDMDENGTQEFEPLLCALELASEKPRALSFYVASSNSVDTRRLKPHAAGRSRQGATDSAARAFSIHCGKNQEDSCQ